MIELKGIIPASPVPYREDRSIAVEDTHRLVDYLVEGGVGGMLATGHCSEVQKLTLEERALVVKTAVEAADGRIPVIAGVEAESTDGAIRAAESSAEAGADALIVLPPFSHYSALTGVMGGGGGVDPTGEHVARHHAEIAKAVDLPLVLYNYGDTLPAGYTDEALKRLLEIEQVVAVKQVSFIPEAYRRQRSVIAAARPDVSILAADVVSLVSGLLRGADGALIGIGNVAPRLWVEMFELAARGELRAAQEIQDRLQPLMLAFHPIPFFVPRQRIALKLLGLFETSQFRPPVWLSEDDEPVVREALEGCQLMDEGVLQQTAVR